ncbi:MAG: hypoxanthine phosphoribosyltransferase [Oligoflexales bacterium]
MMQNKDYSVLVSEEEIKKIVRGLGARIEKDFAGRKLVVVGVLRGAFVFVADLIRTINLPMDVEFIGVSSYQGKTSTGNVQIKQDLSAPIADKDVLLVEDIIDTGITVKYLLETFKQRGPKSIKTCCLLSKPSVHGSHIAIDYVGKEIGDEFVVGYGLDFNGTYRNLPFLAELKPKSDQSI